MPLLPQSNGLLFLLGGASVVAYLAYEYKEKLQMSKKFKAALADIQSSDVTTQTIGVESLIGYVSSNKALIKDLCEHTDIFKELPQLIFSDDEDAQYAVLELLSIISEEDRGLDVIRHFTLYGPLLASLSFPSVSDDVIKCALSTVRNCTRPPFSSSSPSPSPSPSPAISSSSPSPSPKVVTPRGNTRDSDYEKELSWFAVELYTQHGLEAVVNKLLADHDPEIQSLSLQIISNYCRSQKNQDEIGELGGIGFMLEIFTSSLSSFSLSSLALEAIRYSVQTCTCNVEQFRKNGGIKAIVTYFKNEAPPTLQGSEQDQQIKIFNALKILNSTIDSSGIETIRTENVIPQFVGYFMQDVNQDIKNTTVTFLKQLAHSDPKSRREISDAFKKVNRLGNAGVPPSSSSSSSASASSSSSSSSSSANSGSVPASR